MFRLVPELNKRTRKLLSLLPAAFVLLSAAVFGVAQESSGIKQNARPEMAPSAPATGSPKKESEDKITRFFYEFKQPEFYIRHIVIDHDASGRGRLTFERKNETPIEEPFEMSGEALGRVAGLWQALRFLDSTEEYQSERQYPHLGTVFLTMSYETRKRTAEFNWTNNKDASALVNEYRRIADQAIFVFDITVARETQPLNAPKLMEGLELLLKRNGLSDPKQLLPLLKDLSSDEHIPLIARNHAARLVKKIEK